MSSGAAQSLPQRLWIYQAERFPLGRTALLLAVFTSASVSLSAVLGGRDLPLVISYAVAFLVGLVLMFQLRAADEVKDADDDRRYRPERAVPRGLVSLREVVGLALAAGVVAAVLLGLLDVGLLLPLAAVWVWLGLMSVEFFVPEWLRARPFLYMVSHMLIMPLIDLLVTAVEWLPAGALPHGLWLFLLLSFLNGCILEIGRKIYAPANERPGVETYSVLLGPRRAVLAWCGCLILAWIDLVAVGWMAGTPVAVGAIGLLGLAFALVAGLRFLRSPTAANQKLIDTAAGVSVLVAYGAAGFVPVLARSLA